MADAPNTKSKIKPGVIELDPIEPTVIVNFEKQTLDVSGPEPVVIEKKPSSKRIKLKEFDQTSDVALFAKEIIENCKYIHPGKQAFIEDLLRQLQARIAGASQQAQAEVQQQQAVEVQDDLERMRRKDAERREREKAKEAMRASRDQAASAPSSDATAAFNPHQAERERADKERANREAWERQREAEIRERLEREAWERQREAELRDRIERDVREKVEKEAREAAAAATAAAQAAAAAAEAALAEARAEKEKSSKSDKEKSSKERDKERDREKAVREKEKEKERAKRPPTASSVRASAEMRASVDAPGVNSTNVRDEQLMIEYDTIVQLPKEEARMQSVEEYIELLYEERMEDKVRGTSAILQLVQDPRNLGYFLEHDTMLTALTRILNEDRRKSVDLVTNLLEIFFCFSNFSSLHYVLLQNKIGDLTMRVVDLELKRYDLRMKEEKGKKPTPKLAQFFSKQERLLYVSFYILLNLAEDANIELKMVNRGIVRYLARTLERRNTDRELLDDLHLLSVTFLKKLSIYHENKAEMAENRLVESLSRFVPYDNEDLMMAALRLLYNLSFDAHMRAAMTACGLISGLTEALRRPLFAQTAVKVLYHISMDAEHRQTLAFTPVPAYVAQLIIRYPKKQVDRELMALAVNLALQPRCAETFVAAEPDNLQQLMRRAHQTYDALLLKLLRTIARHEIASTREPFRRYMHELVGMALHCQTPDAHDALVEIVGTLALLTFADVSYADLIAQHGLVEFCVKHLMPGFAEDDIVLECVALIGVLATDPHAAPALANPRLIRCMQEVMHEKAEDDEIVLQVCFSLFKLLLHAEPREVILQNDYCIATLTEHLHAPNPAVRRVVNDALEVIIECGGQGWHDRIMEKRFEYHNREWLQLMHELAQQQRAQQHLMGGGGGMPMHPDLQQHMAGDGGGGGGDEYLSEYGGGSAQHMRMSQQQMHGGGGGGGGNYGRGSYDYDEEAELSQSM